MTDTIHQTFGGLTFPIQAGDSLEPARDRLLDLFESVINSEFGDWWTAIAAGLPYGNKFIGTTPVADTLPDVPDLDIIRERKCGFPILAFHPNDEGEIAPHAEYESKLTREWHLHYILGEFDIEGRRKLLDIFAAIGKVLPRVLADFGHHSFESGANQFELAGITEATLKGIKGPGQAHFGEEGDTKYWAARYTFEITEVSEETNDHLSNFGGVDLSVAAGGANEPSISPDFVQGSSDVPYQKP